MALLVTSCTMRNKPSLLLDKGPEYLKTRTNTEMFANKRKSAVELLAASRPQYVKSAAARLSPVAAATTPDRHFRPIATQIEAKPPSRSKSEFDITSLRHLLDLEEESVSPAEDDRHSPEEINKPSDIVSNEQSPQEVEADDRLKDEVSAECVKDKDDRSEDGEGSKEVVSEHLDQTPSYLGSVGPAASPASYVELPRPLPEADRPRRPPPPPPRTSSSSSSLPLLNGRPLAQFPSRSSSQLQFSETATRSSPTLYTARPVFITPAEKPDLSLPLDVVKPENPPSLAKSPKPVPPPKPSRLKKTERPRSLHGPPTAPKPSLAARGAATPDREFGSLGTSPGPRITVTSLPEEEQANHEQTKHQFQPEKLFTPLQSAAECKLSTSAGAAYEEANMEGLHSDSHASTGYDKTPTNPLASEPLLSRSFCEVMQTSTNSSSNSTVTTPQVEQQPQPLPVPVPVGQAAPCCCVETSASRPGSGDSKGSELRQALHHPQQQQPHRPAAATCCLQSAGRPTSVAVSGGTGGPACSNPGQSSGEGVVDGYVPASCSSVNAVPRSFSDIPCHHSRAGSDVSSEASRASITSRTSRASRASAGANLERFFNEMGMERDVLDPLLQLHRKGVGSQQDLYDSVSSLDSLYGDARSICSALSRCSEREGLVSSSDNNLSSAGEALDRGHQLQTSVIERNARIIKWLCSVKKAKTAPPPPPSSSAAAAPAPAPAPAPGPSATTGSAAS